ncbi:MAG: tetratricopeptide repeat protein [Bacteroidia bacterium]
MTHGFFYKLFFLSHLFLVFGFYSYAQKSKPLNEDDKIKFETNFINGTKEKILNNMDEAIKDFKICLSLSPDNSAVNFELSQIYESKLLLEDAEVYAKRAVSFDDKNSWYKKQLASIYKQRKKYLDAAPVYLRIAKDDRDVTMELEAAYMYVLAHELKKAVRVLDHVEEQVGVNEDIIKQKEQIYLSLNKLNKATAEVEKLMRAYPKELKYEGMLADLYMANNKPEQAIKIYNDILKKDSSNGYALFAMADYYRSKNENEKYYTLVKAGMASPTTEIKAKLEMMISFMSSRTFENQPERNYELAHIFIKANPDESTSHMVLADMYNHDKELERAREEYLKAVAIEPANYEVWQQIIFCSSELRNNSYLQRDCELALEYFPNEAPIYMYHAIASEQLKDYEKAFNSAKKGLENVAGQKELSIQLYSVLGDAAFYLKRYDACDSAYEEALKLNERNAYALNNYAYFLSVRNIHLDKAEKMSKQSLEIEPDNSSYMDTYGWILYRMNDLTKAKEFIEKSLKVTPNSAEVLEHLGDVLFKLSQPEEALKNWKRAKELGGESEFLDKKIAEGKLYE